MNFIVRFLHIFFSLAVQVERFQEGDEVTMVDDLQMVKTFLSGYGGWSSHMQQVIQCSIEQSMRRYVCLC